eukprot:4148674-Pyramimonas_sp.AAC.2
MGASTQQPRSSKGFDRAHMTNFAWPLAAVRPLSLVHVFSMYDDVTNTYCTLVRIRSCRPEMLGEA